MIPTMEMRDVARRLIRDELGRGGSTETEDHAAFRVCEKLRTSLSSLLGTEGFRSLLSRALALAKIEAPWLGVLQINGDGSLALPSAIEAHLHKDEAAEAGAVLIEQFLELLATFIGEGLTLRFVQEWWPKVALNDLKLEGIKYEKPIYRDRT